MKTPVTTALPAVRPAAPAPRASGAGSAHSAAPFASALDGALHESRAADRRGAPEERAERADLRADAKDRRIDERGRAADQRAADKTARAESRAAERTTDKAEKAASETDATPGRPVDEATVPDEVAPETDETTDSAGRSAEAPRGGLPALWALLMGSSVATTPVQDAAPEGGAAAPLPVVPAVDAATGGVPATTPTAGSVTPVDATAVPAATTTGPATAETVATPSAPAAPTGEGLPAGFAAVLAEAGAAVTASATPGTTAAATDPAPTAAPALPVDLVLDAATATGTPVPTEAPAVVPSSAPVVADGQGEPATGSTSADAVVAPAGGTPGEALSADAGGAGQPGGDDAPPAPATTSQPTVGPATSVATSATAAVADVDGATGTSATLPVGSQVARQVAVLSGGPDGDHSMTLVLTPDTLGEVQVQVTLSKGSIELALRGAHEHGRAALLDALPELRRELEAAGLNPSRVEVSRDTGGSLLDRQPTPQHGFGERGGQHDRGDNRSRPWGRPADIAGSGPSLNPNRSTSSGVDLLV